MPPLSRVFFSAAGGVEMFQQYSPWCISEKFSRVFVLYLVDGLGNSSAKVPPPESFRSYLGANRELLGFVKVCCGCLAFVMFTHMLEHQMGRKWLPNDHICMGIGTALDFITQRLPDGQ